MSGAVAESVALGSEFTVRVRLYDVRETKLPILRHGAKFIVMAPAGQEYRVELKQRDVHTRNVRKVMS